MSISRGNLTILTGVTLLLGCLFQGYFCRLLGCACELKGTAWQCNTSVSHDILYDTKIKNTTSLPIRLCGGQLNWCGKGGCYNVITPLPITLKSNQETTISVAISPREEELSETELTLYADGEGLAGLTPIIVKLPAVSHNKSR